MKLGKMFLFFIMLSVIFPIASYASELEDGTAAMDSGDYQQAYKLLYPLAEQGNPAAQDCIGAMYCEGLGVEKDEALAFSWYEKSADQGFAEAQNALGAMYVNGVGVEQDIQKGLSYIVKAAQQGLEVAKQNAYALYYQEAQNGNVGAMHNVGIMCLQGWAGDADALNCIKLLEVAAQNGYTKSASVLSKIYNNGSFGIEPDEEKADFWKNFAENPPEAPVAN